ncbi:MAG: hypothetical protein HXY42_06560 [Chloroflexi bacterium]|nr:hypothetical protein [Chloroflexota bacterium]
MNPTRIVIDGKTYNSVNEMPPEIRAKYEQATADAKRERTADFAGQTAQPFAFNAMKFVVDGKEYDSLDDLPPEARAKYEEAMNMLDKNRNGVPDLVEGMMGMFSQPSAPQNTPTAGTARRPAPQKVPPPSPAIAPDTSGGWLLAAAGFLLLFLCAAGALGVWYFFLR